MVTSGCKTLLDICGLDIYGRNAFRLLGVDVDIKGRRIKRNEMEFKAALEVGELADEYCNTFRPDPLPTREELSQAGRVLTDVQQRFVHEFFWFWPLVWGKSASDKVLKLIKSNKVKEAQKQWRQIVANGDEASSVAKHNLAVLGHWLALNQERKILVSTDNGKLTREKRKQLNSYWSFAFRYWESLCADEAFWSVQADRIRALDDPRLTTGFLRRFTQSLPIAFDNINADLAVAYCDREMYVRAKDHVQIMIATNAGDDDVDTSRRRVTEPLHGRIDHAIETATSQLHNNKTEGKQRCIELFKTVRHLLNVILILLGEESQEFTETCDRVAKSMLQCQVTYANETQDWKSSLFLLEAALKVARGAETLAIIKQNIAVVRQNMQADMCWFCENLKKEEVHAIEVILKKSIKWRDIKSDPERYREAIQQMVSQFISQLKTQLPAMRFGQINSPGMAFFTEIILAAKRGDLHAIVRALDSRVDDWTEMMSQQVTTTVPRCGICAAVHSRGASETVDTIQKKLKTANATVERAANKMESLKEKIASHLQAREEARFLRKRLMSSRLESLHSQEEEWKRRHQEAKRERARLQSQLKKKKAEGNIKEYRHFEAWPAVVQAKKDGFQIS